MTQVADRPGSTHTWLVTEFEDFHRDFLPRFIAAQAKFHQGDPEPNIALWTATEPVTLFAARGICNIGTDQVTDTFRRVSAEFSDAQGFEWELLASGESGDLAYTVSIERYTASIKGGSPVPTELRSTHVFRRENGHWRAVHRHADRKQPD